MSFASFSLKEQKRIRDKVENIVPSSQDRHTIQELVNFTFATKFDSWLKKVISIDPTTVRPEDRDTIVNELFNGEGRFFFSLIDNGPFEKWDQVVKVPLLALVKNLTFPQCACMGWSGLFIKNGFNLQPKPAEFSDSQELTECLQLFSETMNQRFRNILYNSIPEKHPELRHLVFFVFSTKFPVWFNKVRNINPLTVKPEERQSLVDEIFNAEGEFFYMLLNNGFFHCWDPAAQVPILQLANNGYDCAIKTDWCISTDFKTGRRLVIKKTCVIKDQVYVATTLTPEKWQERIQQDRRDVLVADMGNHGDD